MTTNTQQSEQRYYFHNIKATVLFSFKSDPRFDWLQIKENGFNFSHNPKANRVWHNSTYFPISVTRNSKPWGHFDTSRQKLHIVTRGDLKGQLSSFADLLKRFVPDLAIRGIELKYVEICTRYEDKYFNEVSKLIKKAESRFFTSTKTDSFDKRIKGQTWQTLGRELSIKETKLNIKTYRFVNEITSRKRTISESVLPKIEVQIYKPKSLGEAKRLAVPIIKSFQEQIGFETRSMDGESDYAQIQDTLSLSHNQKLFDLFNEKYVAVLRFPEIITGNNLIYNVACFLTSEAKTRKEIVAKFNIGKSKLNRVLGTLSPFLEKRGNNAIGLYYQIDSELIEQYSDNNKGKANVLTSHRINNITSNKKNRISSQTKRVTIIKKEKVTSTTQINVKKVVTTMSLLIINHFFIKDIGFLTLFI